MRNFAKQYTAEQIETAKAYINKNFDTRATSGEDYDRMLGQVLQLQNPAGRPWDIGELDAEIFAKPIQHSYLEGEYLQGLNPEPLLTRDNIRKMPEMRKSNQDFEDKVVGRLMLAIARGELELELDGTPDGKARDMVAIKNYLDTAVDIGIHLESTPSERPALKFTPNIMLLLSKAGQTQGDELNGAMAFGGLPVSEARQEMHEARRIRPVIITPISDKDE